MTPKEHNDRASALRKMMESDGWAYMDELIKSGKDAALELLLANGDDEQRGRVNALSELTETIDEWIRYTDEKYEDKPDLLV